MKKLFSISILLLLPLVKIFAHEGEEEITNLAEADWWGPIIAIIIIALVIMISKRIKKVVTRN
ncbi:MAG: hypothetical protein HYY55_01620 [Candidatus Niyogibacteria bacterium]|nr:MAG: hypothetical protein HYY55_01620 [Candidatus Niyogibacteria bacterium]